MMLSQLKLLVADAEKQAARKGETADDYPVYVIDGPDVRGIRTYSPADWNRGGVAFILEAARPSQSSGPVLVPVDEWGRARCQQIGVYADVDEFFQCAMVAGHDGECDPLPEQPTAEEAERLLAGAYVTVPVADASGLAAQMMRPSSEN